VLQLRQATQHVGDPTGGHIVPLQQGWIKAKKADHFGAAIAAGRQAQIIRQPQVPAMPKQN
jgi:hypothetical protein